MKNFFKFIFVIGILVYAGHFLKSRTNDFKNSLLKLPIGSRNIQDEPSRNKDVQNRSYSSEQKDSSDFQPNRLDVAYEGEGEFQLASPPVSTDFIKSYFAKGVVVDGILIKADFKELRSKFEAGQKFRVPIVGSQFVDVIPKKVIVNLDGTNVFIGESENNQQHGLHAQINEVNLIFLDERLIMGQISTQGRQFQIVSRGDLQLLVELSPDTKID